MRVATHVGKAPQDCKRWRLYTDVACHESSLIADATAVLREVLVSKKQRGLKLVKSGTDRDGGRVAGTIHKQPWLVVFHTHAAAMPLDRSLKIG